MGFPQFTATSVTPTRPTTHMAPLIQKLRRHMARWLFSGLSGPSAAAHQQLLVAPTPHADLFLEPIYVELDCALPDKHRAGDVLVRQPLCHQPGDLSLAFGQYARWAFIASRTQGDRCLTLGGLRQWQVHRHPCSELLDCMPMNAELLQESNRDRRL